MEYRFAEPVLLYCGGMRMRALRAEEALRLIARGSVARPRRKVVRYLEIRHPGAKGLPGRTAGWRTVYRERLGSGGTVWQHRFARL